jgi:ABC-type phosphonate transport system ATPase subunit
LSKVGIPEKRDNYPAQLTGGQQQRVAVARAFAMQPKTMLFDEPTPALVPKMINQLLEVMVNLAKEKDGHDRCDSRDWLRQEGFPPHNSGLDLLIFPARCGNK